MIDISVNELNKYYGSNHVIKGVTFEIYSGEKIGLLGKNGSGKTTLFKILSGQEYYESGNISKASGKRIELLAQIPTFGANESSEDILRSAFKDVSDIFTEMKRIEGDETTSVLVRYGQLMEEYERRGGYETEVKLDKVCRGMTIDERMRKSVFAQLSGGEKTRVNLARILLRDCDMLLLDEPTNHLDLLSIEWLERFLYEFKGTVVVISHDRVFLDYVITRVIEIDDGKANFYKGNYSFYLKEKEQRFLSKTEQFEQQQKKIRQLDAAIKRQRVWAQINPSNTGLAKRALAMEKRIEQMDKIEKPVTTTGLSEKFDSGGHAAKEVVSFDSVYKSYKTKLILTNLNLKIYRNDCIALVGENGCGKSTILKMIMNEEQYDSGLMKVSTNIKPAYMPQIITFENNDASVLDTLRTEIGVPEDKARSILADFRFRADDVMKKVSTLSGGEKSRLKICLMMQNNANFLLLDEPTNHLDIASREWIENALTDFDGTVLFVSHDRYFLNKFATKVWSMDNGVITQYDYGFKEYLQITRLAKIQKNKDKKPSLKQKISVKPAKEIIEISTETLIAEAEAELAKINEDIEYDLANSDFLNMNVLYEKKSQIEEKIEVLYYKWLENN